MVGLTSADDGSSQINGVSYVGIAKYCYANSVAMLLAGIDEHISPSLIEVLTGVGLGAFLENDGLLFFSNPTGMPDIGISKAMEILGFTFEEKFSKISDIDPFGALEDDLQNSSAVLGPLDMSYLVYIPGHQYMRGSAIDHFVLVYGIDQDKLYLHDPAGYPHVLISRPEMLLAWKAENVTYRRGYYRYWSSPKRIASPSGGDIYQDALRWFKSIYEDSSVKSVKENTPIGSAVIRKVADRIESEALSSEEIGHLTRFALPLEAKRAIDFASFFGPHNKTLADLKYSQSRVFGEAHSCLGRRDWRGTAHLFQQLAELEDKIRGAIMSQ
ncbi:MAG: hypothetical protein JSV77_01365 [Dehalococcoidales bacterium]|nr:MAG: hypothetical protein JSV77_01365 [Dehalococcoidales bacterium]